MDGDENPLENIGPLGGLFGMISKEQLMNMLQGKKQNRERIGILDADDVKMWNELKAESARLNKERSKLINKSRIFWSTIELKYDANGRQNFDIDEVTGEITADKEEA